MLFELLATAGALVHRRLDANALNACAGLFSAVQKWPGPSVRVPFWTRVTKPF